MTKEMKHTPGPWRAPPFVSSSGGWVGGPTISRKTVEAVRVDHMRGTFEVDGGLKVFRPDEKTIEICSVVTAKSDVSNEMNAEFEANARLIAAAPDLLRAAKYFEWCADVHGDGSASHCAVCDAHEADGHTVDCWLGAAIAKAEGVSP
jgi:hypothetical protein